MRLDSAVRSQLLIRAGYNTLRGVSQKNGVISLGYNRYTARLIPWFFQKCLGFR